MAGGQLIMMFCDKVRRDDIVVQIIEENEHKQIVWKTEIDNSTNTLEVHHQYGIAFYMPPYHDPMAMISRQCYIQLYRPSDNEFSEAIPFELLPSEQSKC